MAGGLGRPLRTLGAARVAALLADSEPFGRGCRRRSERARDAHERAAWAALAASDPCAVWRSLERAGYERPVRRKERGQTGGGEEVAVLHELSAGCASFGRGAALTPFQEELARIAPALERAAA
jgi:predicted Fe-S protein YdhL (DUF1289 family)